MSDYQISSVGQPYIKTIIANQNGYVQGVDTDFAGARSGSSTGQTIGGLNVGLYYTGGVYRLQRGFLQFEVPENLSRVDGPVVVSIYALAFVGVSRLNVVATSIVRL